jgi:hypothetical protein
LFLRIFSGLWAVKESYATLEVYFHENICPGNRCCTSPEMLQTNFQLRRLTEESVEMKRRIYENDILKQQIATLPESTAAGHAESVSGNRLS